MIDDQSSEIEFYAEIDAENGQVLLGAAERNDRVFLEVLEPEEDGTESTLLLLTADQVADLILGLIAWAEWHDESLGAPRGR